MRGKILLDTNVFIDFLRDGRHVELVAGRVEGTVRLLSSVVLLELRLGANTPPRKRAVDRLRAVFPPSRIVSPGAELLDRAGQVFNRFHADLGAPPDRLGAMNDLLIALTARHIGATLVTSNVDDFRRLEGYVRGLRWTTPV